VGHRDTWRAEPRAGEWLLIEWAQGEPERAKYWLSTISNDIAFDRLVDLAKLRWRIERDYQELKQSSALAITKGVGGAASTTTPHSVSPPTASDRRTRRPFPLRTALHPALLGICPSRPLPTPRRRRSAPNAMCRTRSQPCADVLSSPSPGPSRDALVAMCQSEKPAKFPITDAVRLAGC
jgi:hypothetical protein